MDTSVKHCVLNACVGGNWYPKGQERLVRSLVFHGSAADHLTFKDTWPTPGYNTDCPYHIKPSAFEYAIEQGYRRILWLDCSVWAIKNPMPVWDVINSEGFYIWRSGYNAAQTCSDKCLEYFGVTRDEAEKIPDSNTSMFGVNMDNPTAEQFITRWIRAAKKGAFEGSRLHDNQSSDPRFLFHRQDQSAATLIAHQLNLKLHNPGEYSAFYEPNPPESVVFLMKGL